MERNLSELKTAQNDFKDAFLNGLPTMGKTWVVIWAGAILPLPNLAAIGFVWDYVGIVVLLGFIVAFLPNSFVVVKYHGITKGMGWGHYLGLGPSVAFCVVRITTDFAGVERATFEDNPAVFVFACVAAVINTISLLFDGVDTVLWFGGCNKEVIIGPNTAERLGLTGPIVTTEEMLAALERERQSS